MMVQDDLFSQEALKRMQAPDKLNTLLQVTNPLGWMALSAVILFLLAVVIWSFIGAFTVKADGYGLILDPGGVENVTHIASGKIEDIYVHRGSTVKKGDLLATMINPEQTANTVMAQSDMTLASNYTEAQGRASQYNSRRYQEKISSDIVSPVDGVVDEVVITKGNIVTAGNLICTIRRNYGGDLNGVVYVSLDKGKRIEPGMTIQLSPNASDESKSGSLVGIVRTVSQYPVNTAGIREQLGNEYMAQWVLQKLQGPAVEVTFNLVKDASNESGYLWTSVVGKKRPITPGTFVNGSVIIERKPPIEWVFFRITDWLNNR